MKPPKFRFVDINHDLSMRFDPNDLDFPPMVNGAKMYDKPVNVAEALARKMLRLRANLEELEALDEAWRRHCSRIMRATRPETGGCPDGCGNDCCVPPNDEDDT